MRIDRDNLTLAGLVVALMVGFTVGLWFPHRRAVAAKQQEIDNQQQQFSSILAKTAPVASRSDHDVPAVDRELAIPPGAQLGPLLAQIGEDLKVGAVSDQQLQAKAIVDGGDFSRIPLVLHFRSTFGVLFEFLGRIESHKRIIRIDRVVVRADGSDPQHPLRVDIELSTFFGGPQETRS